MCAIVSAIWRREHWSFAVTETGRRIQICHWNCGETSPMRSCVFSPGVGTLRTWNEPISLMPFSGSSWRSLNAAAAYRVKRQWIHYINAPRGEVHRRRDTSGPWW